MASDISGTYSRDLVGIFKQDYFEQLFVNARSINVKVGTTSTVMSHPVEDGSTITDHKVINPVTIEMSMIISSADYRDVYESIYKAFDSSELLTVQTKSGIYRSMIISAMPHDEDPSMFDAISLAVKLTEVKFATFSTGTAPRVSKPKDKKNTKTSNTGKKNTDSSKKTPDKKSSILYGIFQ